MGNEHRCVGRSLMACCKFLVYNSYGPMSAVHSSVHVVMGSASGFNSDRMESCPPAWAPILAPPPRRRPGARHTPPRREATGAGPGPAWPRPCPRLSQLDRRTHGIRRTPTPARSQVTGLRTAFVPPPRARDGGSTSGSPTAHALRSL